LQQLATERGYSRPRETRAWKLQKVIVNQQRIRRSVIRPRMLLGHVEYARPQSLDAALRALGEHENARALAGGQTLVNVMKVRAAAPDVLVDLADLGELRTISRSAEGGLEIGAMVTYSDLMTSADVGETRPILAEVAAQIADVQVRNRGTIGGNVCSSDPTNHLPPLMVAMGATMVIAGQAGERRVSADEFFLGVYFTAVASGELLTRIEISPGHGDGFASVTIGKDGTCIVNAAASRNGGLRIAIGCVAAVPVLVQPGGEDEDSVRSAVQEASLDPPSDVHASADYRRHLAGVLAERAVRQAAG
jgi:aerobic carbon-monoxide dehydrogenase medium subunit